MALPLKDLPLGVRQHTHKVLTRIAKNRGITLSELGRKIIEEYVDVATHDAKVVLGMDDDKVEQTELDLDEGESHRLPPKSAKR